MLPLLQEVRHHGSAVSQAVERTAFSADAATSAPPHETRAVKALDTAACERRRDEAESSQRSIGGHSLGLEEAACDVREARCAGFFAQ
jgi:hypothetical protein